MHHTSHIKKTTGEREEFDPSIFFALQKDAGMRPYVCIEGIGFRPAIRDDAKLLLRWADDVDPGRRRRKEYAAAAWDKRNPGQILVFLG